MMANLIPHFIHAQKQAGRTKGHFQAAALTVDISGFTLLTETLMQHGKEGVDTLTQSLNNIFNPLVAEVYARNGFITTFAGDAFTALFPGRAGARSAAQTALVMRDFLDQNRVIHSRYGDFNLAIRIGLGRGRIQWGILGTGISQAYFFRGPAVQACAQAEQAAQAGDILVTENFAAGLGNRFQLEAAGDYSRLIRDLATSASRAVMPPSLSPADMQVFVPGSVLNLSLAAEFRNLASVFIAIDESTPFKSLDTFIRRVLRNVVTYDGYFNKLDFGGKGGVIVVLFGAPVAHENDLQRAADFLLALQSEKGSVKWRAGLSFGRAYAGFLGGTARSEYTAIGDTVNLAARLMTEATWGEVWTSPTAARHLEKHYLLEMLNTISLKGIREAVRVSRLVQRRGSAEESTSDSIIGREVELQQVTAWTKSASQGFAGMLYIYGEPGMGKTRLAAEAAQSKDLTWMTCPADEILRQSLNPFRYALRQYFRQIADRPVQENKARFDEILNRLIVSLSPDDSLRAELERLRSFLGILVDLRWPGSLYESLEPKLRFENTLSAFKTLILAESRQRPVIVHVEDVHWLDSDSHEMLKILTRNVGEYSFGILLTSRYADDGTPIRVGVDEGVPIHMIDLARLSPDVTARVAADTLGNEISSALRDVLVSKCEGNPFFVRQLTLDLRERGIIEFSGQIWTITQQQISTVPNSITAVLVARLDRLFAHLKSIVQTAAVLGREFEVNILSQMLRNDVSGEVRQAESEGIWDALTAIRYLFRHTLLRDAAYEMQLESRLRELHALAAQAIEQVYANDLTPHYADLAYHYGRAENHAQERYYARLAGEQAAARFANDEALRFLGRALELTDDPGERYGILLAQENVYDLKGAREMQVAALDALDAAATQVGDLHKQAESRLRRAAYAEKTSDFEAARTTAESIPGLSDDPALRAGALYVLSMSLSRQGQYRQAGEQLEQAMTLAHSAGMRDIEADCIRHLGAVTLNQGNFDQANLYLGRAQQLYEQLGNRRGVANCINNLGSVAYMQGNYEGAKANMEQAAAMYAQIGDRYGESFVVGNLGAVSFFTGNLVAARDYFRQSLHLTREIGNRFGESHVLANLGAISVMLGDHAAALGYLDYGEILSREINEKPRLVFGLASRSLMYHHLGEQKLALEYAQRALEISKEIESRTYETIALNFLGNAWAMLGQLDEAQAEYQRALELHRELGEFHLTGDALAGLARISMGRSDLAGAMIHTEEILSAMESRFRNCSEPVRIYLTAYQVLKANDDPRAGDVLRQGHEYLMGVREQFEDDDQRRMYIENIPAHRELLSIWRSTQAESHDPVD